MEILTLWGNIQERRLGEASPEKPFVFHSETISNGRENGKKDGKRENGRREKGKEKKRKKEGGGECFNVFLQSKFPHQEKWCHAKVY